MDAAWMAAVLSELFVFLLAHQPALAGVPSNTVVESSYSHKEVTPCQQSWLVDFGETDQTFGELHRPETITADSDRLAIVLSWTSQSSGFTSTSQSLRQATSERLVLTRWNRRHLRGLLSSAIIHLCKWPVDSFLRRRRSTAAHMTAGVYQME